MHSQSRYTSSVPEPRFRASRHLFVCTRLLTNEITESQGNACVDYVLDAAAAARGRDWLAKLAGTELVLYSQVRLRQKHATNERSRVRIIQRKHARGCAFRFAGGSSWLCGGCLLLYCHILFVQNCLGTHHTHTREFR